MRESSSTGRCIRVAIVENDPLRLAGFRALLDSHEDLQFASLSLSELGNAREINVMLLGNGHKEFPFGAMQHLMMIRPGLRVILTGSGGDNETVLNALASGAKGYVDEAAPVEEFVNAIRTVAKGLIWVPRRVRALFIDRVARASGKQMSRDQITGRERQVLEMLVGGRSNKEIAVPLGIQERTVKAHVSKLMRKIGVQNRIMLSVHAVNQGLVCPEII